MSIWQTHSWQEMLQKSGQVEAFFEVGGVFIEKRKVSIGEYGLFVIGEDVNKKKEKDFENLLIDLCKKENCLFIQVETIDYNSNSLSYLSNSSFKKGCYKKFITPYTAVIDLYKTEDEILSGMKPKGRYNIRLAEKKGVECMVVEKTDENIKHFYNIILETTTRDGFSGNTFNYYKTFLQEISDSQLILAYKDGEPISGGIFIFDKEVAIYYYGASSNRYRNLMSPYLLQWTAIKYGKKVGSKIYDFLGVASPDDKKSSLVGVTDFKKKLTCDIRKVSEGYIRINKKFKYNLINLLRKFK